VADRHFYEFGRFRLDPIGRVIYRGNEVVPVPPKAADALLLLVQNAGHVVEKEELLRRLWPDTAVEEGSLTRTISILRKSLGDGEEGQEYIATVSKRGYRFVAAVTTVEESSISGVMSRGSTRFQWKRAWTVALIAIFVVGSAYFGWRNLRSGRTEQRRLMVAVLPVQNLTGDAERQYIADGLTEEIIAELSRYNPERLGVIARTSSMAYRITGKTVQQIGGELGVDYLVESSLRADGDRMRITSQLVRVQDQTHIWSATYDRTLHDLLSLEAEVSQAIALNIGVKLQTAARSRLTPGRPINPDAYLAYLEGRYYWNRRSPEALELAITHFQQAIQLDPSYALAYDGLADAYASQVLISDVPPLEVFPKAKAAALKALELDGELAEAHTSLAYLKFWYDWDWSGAETEFKRALDLNPGYATGHQWYAEFLRLMGRQEEAIAENRKALELDPLSLIINMESGLPYYQERRYDEAIPYYRKTLELDPNFGLAHCVLAWSYEGKGQYPEAIAALEKARQLDDSSAVLASLGHVYAVTGRTRDAERIIAQLRERAKTQYVSPYFLSSIYAGLHEDQRALDALDEAYTKHDWVLLWLNVGRTMDPLRSQPRFVNLERRLNFPVRLAQH
jgi:TolB-like protein/DNA-binding winged helix-turn-helix (wHTH) protein/Tfp pilus assembly protein PilF